MQTQLVLLEDETSDWRLDEHTRERGRQGVAAAREELARMSNREAVSAA